MCNMLSMYLREIINRLFLVFNLKVNASHLSIIVNKVLSN